MGAKEEVPKSLRKTLDFITLIAFNLPSLALQTYIAYPRVLTGSATYVEGMSMASALLEMGYIIASHIPKLGPNKLRKVAVAWLFMTDTYLRIYVFCIIRIMVVFQSVERGYAVCFIAAITLPYQFLTQWFCNEKSETKWYTKVWDGVILAACSSFPLYSALPENKYVKSFKSWEYKIRIVAINICILLGCSIFMTVNKNVIISDIAGQGQYSIDYQENVDMINTYNKLLKYLLIPTIVAMMINLICQYYLNSVTDALDIDLWGLSSCQSYWGAFDEMEHKMEKQYTKVEKEMQKQMTKVEAKFLKEDPDQENDAASPSATAAASPSASASFGGDILVSQSLAA